MNRYRIYQNVRFGADCQIGDFSSIGLPPKGFADGELLTTIGDRAEIQSHATVSSGNVIGHDFVAGHGLYMRHNSRIGDRVSIGPHSIMEWNVTIEDDVTIGPYAGIAEFTVIERGGWLGPQVALPSVLHPLCAKAKECGRGSHLYRGVTIGGGVIVYPDLRIGAGAYLEPCSVIVSDVRPFAVMAGNPAKEIGDIFSLNSALVDRLQTYLDLSPDAVAATIAQFEQTPTLFPVR